MILVENSLHGMHTSEQTLQIDFLFNPSLIHGWPSLDLKQLSKRSARSFKFISLTSKSCEEMFQDQSSGCPPLWYLLAIHTKTAWRFNHFDGFITWSYNILLFIKLFSPDRCPMLLYSDVLCMEVILVSQKVSHTIACKERPSLALNAVGRATSSQCHALDMNLCGPLRRLHTQ